MEYIILTFLIFLTILTIKNMAQISDIAQAVTDLGTVEDSVLLILTTVETQLATAIAANDPAAIQAVLDQISAQKAKLSAAVTANTPAA